MNTHISYEVSKRLKEFLGDSAPEPMGGYYWTEDMSFRHLALYRRNAYAAYQLHDLLSKPFCEAFSKGGVWQVIYDILAIANREGGLPAVEKALIEMMEGK